MIIRAKTKTLFEGKALTSKQQENSNMNLYEIGSGQTVLDSKPRRLVFELTNVCNLNCVMCGRNAADFTPTMFRLDWFNWFEPLMDTIEEVTLMGWGEPTIHPDFTKMLEIINRHSARKYFCTNGMALDKLTDAIFKNNVDVFAVSVDGATCETNGRIRRGSDLDKITRDLERIVRIKKENGLSYPYINFVFCAMKSNIRELPDLIRLASKIGIEEVKVVYLTVFEESLRSESLWNDMGLVSDVFHQAEALGDELGILLKFPHICGEDPAGEKNHKDCFVAWRDFYLGSDGYVRPCMSTPVKFFRFDMNKSFDEMWNDESFIKYRSGVNVEGRMDEPCKRCYQSSHCNWNRRSSFLQINTEFAPSWSK
jgi:radical SAM protein with 4Fe4S-binding SPASM domain